MTQSIYFLSDRTKQIANASQSEKVKKLARKWFDTLFPAVKATLNVAEVDKSRCQLITQGLIPSLYGLIITGLIFLLQVLILWEGSES